MGEELLSPQKIEYLAGTFDNYGIIDYEHQFTFKNKPMYLTTIGEPVKHWITENETTFTDITGNKVTTPAGTLFGSVRITDKNIIQQIQDKTLSAFSVSVAEKTDAIKVMNEYNKIKSNIATKNNIDHDLIQKVSENISNKQTLIKDIQDPVLFTVTLTKLPCVNKAMFCENSLNINNTINNPVTASKSKGYGDKMKENKEDTFFNNLKASLKSYTSSANKSKEKDDEVKEDVKQEDENKIDEVVEKIETSNKNFNDNMESLKKEVDDVKTSVKSEMDKLREEVAQELATEQEKEEKEKDTGETPVEPEKQEEEKEQEEKEPEKETKIAGKGNKSMSAHKEKETKEVKDVNTSAQLNSPSDGIGATKSYHQTEISEREWLYNFIKGGSLANKSLDDVKISYKGLSIIPEAVPTAPAFSLIAPALKADFSASYTEADTNKLILDTGRYGLYMRQLLSVDPLMQDANFRIDYEVSDEEKVMYALRLDEDPTQDGAMPEHYYFDNEVDAASITVSKQKLHPEPVRALLHISDRQIKQNVFGESLVENSLKIIQDGYNEGVSRINYFSDTTYANTVDIKFRRRDGLLKTAGEVLNSDDVAGAGGSGDFDIDDGIEKVVKTMFRALPYEAQKDSMFNLYVPPYVYDAYRQYYLTNDKINFLGNITDEIPLKYNKITVKEAPILADPAGIELYGDKVPMLLASPQNTHFSASRALRIEPERLASTSSTKYWYSGDFDCKFALPEYSIVANISKAEYEAL